MNFNKWTSLIFFLCCCVQQSPLEAWIDTGHMVVAEIARSQLKPSVLTQTDHLIDLWGKNYPDSNTFVTSSCWVDDLSIYGLKAFDTWHFMLIPYDPDKVLTEDKKKLAIAQTTNNNVEWAIKQCIATLSNAQAKPAEKAMALRFLIHFVADIHQPLHVTSLFSAKFPDGDQGGNQYTISGVKSPNLHAYWDSGLGMFESIKRPLEWSSKRKIEKFAEKITAAFPLEKAKEENLIHDKVEEWAKEGEKIASTVCYAIPLGTQPTSAYIKSGQEVVTQRIALAGYRLAFLLNALFLQSSDIEGQPKQAK